MSLVWAAVYMLTSAAQQESTYRNLWPEDLHHLPRTLLLPAAFAARRRSCSRASMSEYSASSSGPYLNRQSIMDPHTARKQIPAGCRQKSTMRRQASLRECESSREETHGWSRQHVMHRCMRAPQAGDAQHAGYCSANGSLDSHKPAFHSLGRLSATPALHSRFGAIHGNTGDHALTSS